MGTGMDEVEIQPRPPPPQQHHQPQQQQPPRHHPLRSGAGGLTLSLPLQISGSASAQAAGSSSSKAPPAAPPPPPPAVSVAPSANGSGGGATVGAPPAPERHGHGRDDCWSEGATITLIEAWGDRYLELNRGNLKQKHWKDVADSVSNRENGTKAPKTDVQCKNRLDTLKKKYKLEKSKIFGGGGSSKWAFFNKLDELIGPSRKHQQQQGGNQKLQLQTPHGNVASHSALPALSSGAKPLRRPHPDEPPPPLAVAMNNHHHHHHHHHQLLLPSAAAAAAAAAAQGQAGNHSSSSKSDETPDTTDSYPNGIDMAINGKSHGFKKRRVQESCNPNPSGGNPFKELTAAILKFGEVYERVESSKLQNFIDLEKQRMEFVREMEIQRMQLFMQTQLELAKMKHGKHGNNTEHYL